MLQINADMFFDRQNVEDAELRARRIWLARSGALVRRDARRSMRRRIGPSRPGTPPSVHKGTLKNLIFYALDPATESVVVGPVGRRIGDTTGAAVQEHGGTWWPAGVERPMEIPSRPYMTPAWEANRERIVGMWAGTIK